MRFTLTIELGNEAMKTGDAVSDALKRVSRNIGANIDTFRSDDVGRIMDANGNTVGSWEIED